MTLNNLKNFIFIILLILAATLGGAKAYLDYQLRKQLDIWKNSVADQVIIDYQAVKMSLLGAVIIDNLQLTTTNLVPVQIDRVILHQAYQFYRPNRLPQQLSIAIQGVHIPITDTTSSVPVLIITALGYAPYYLSPSEWRAMGYTDFNADLYLETQFNQDKLHFVGTVAADTWGDLVLVVDLNKVPALETWTSLAGQIQLTTLVVSYISKNLISRVFTRLAQRNTMTTDQFKQTLINKIQNDLQQLRIALEASSQASLQQFIQTPQTLTMQLQPNPPLAISALWNASPAQLGLKITTTTIHQ
jgi:hypothetical protein